MVNVKELIKGDYLTVEDVKQSITKQFVTIDEGEIIDTEYGEKLTIPIQMDGQKYLWQPNKTSMKSIANSIGPETRLWVGKRMLASITKIMGKDSLYVVALYHQQAKLNEEEVVE